MPRQLYTYGTQDCRNLAGRTYADTVIRSELNRASIPIVECDSDGEVPSTIGGRLDDFTFVRGWSYWRVKGLMPYVMARYIHRRRGSEVRTSGFAGGIHPGEHGARWLTDDGVEIWPADQEAEHLAFVERHPAWSHDPAVFTDSPWLSGRRFVTSYHVDTIEGLRFLAKMIRRLRGGGCRPVT